MSTNKIKRLTKADGQFTDDDQMGTMTTSFYRNLYRSEGVSNMGEVLDTVPIKVTAAMNDQLIAPFQEKEVKEALFQMFPTKAPGPDSFPAHFFQRHWDICGEEVTAVVLRVLQGQDDAAAINHIYNYCLDTESGRC